MPLSTPIGRNSVAPQSIAFADAPRTGGNASYNATVVTGAGTGAMQVPSKTLFVSPRFNGTNPFYKNITDALSAAVSGDVIVVYPATYGDRLVLKDGVNLVAVGRVTIKWDDSAGNAPAIDGQYASNIKCSMLGDWYMDMSLTSPSTTACKVGSGGSLYIQRLECSDHATSIVQCTSGIASALTIDDLVWCRTVKVDLSGAHKVSIKGEYVKTDVTLSSSGATTRIDIREIAGTLTISDGTNNLKAALVTGTTAISGGTNSLQLDSVGVVNVSGGTNDAIIAKATGTLTISGGTNKITAQSMARIDVTATSSNHLDVQTMSAKFYVSAGTTHLQLKGSTNTSSRLIDMVGGTLFLDGLNYSANATPTEGDLISIGINSIFHMTNCIVTETNTSKTLYPVVNIVGNSGTEVRINHCRISTSSFAAVRVDIAGRVLIMDSGLRNLDTSTATPSRCIYCTANYVNNTLAIGATYMIVKSMNAVPPLLNECIANAANNNITSYDGIIANTGFAGVAWNNTAPTPNLVVLDV